MAERHYDQAIKITSIQEEYRYVAMTPCSKCGGRLMARKQSLVTDETSGKRHDLLETTCEQCGTPYEFLFDINSFFGNRKSVG